MGLLVGPPCGLLARRGELGESPIEFAARRQILRNIVIALSLRGDSWSNERARAVCIQAAGSRLRSFDLYGGGWIFGFALNSIRFWQLC